MGRKSIRLDQSVNVPMKSTISTRRNDYSVPKADILNGKAYHNSMPIFLSNNQQHSGDFQPYFPTQNQNYKVHRQYKTNNIQNRQQNAWKVSENRNFSNYTNIVSLDETKALDQRKPLDESNIGDVSGWEDGWDEMLKLDTVIAGVDSVALERGAFRT